MLVQQRVGWAQGQKHGEWCALRTERQDNTIHDPHQWYEHILELAIAKGKWEKLVIILLVCNKWGWWYNDEHTHPFYTIFEMHHVCKRWLAPRRMMMMMHAYVCVCCVSLLHTMVALLLIDQVTQSMEKKIRTNAISNTWNLFSAWGGREHSYTKGNKQMGLPSFYISKRLL